MAKVYYDRDADLGVLLDKVVAVIGYGNQGRAQSQNMRDSGVNVIVGGIADASREQAKGDGFATTSVMEAVETADIICLLIPDEVQQRVYQEEIQPALKAGKALDFAHGYNVHYGFIAPPKDVDVIMVAPRMIGVGVRDMYEAGVGVPGFVGVYQDGSGEAWARALALAKAIGCTRAGAIESTFAAETELDHFNEHFVWPAIFRILVGAFEFLTANGYDAETVALELWASKEPMEIMSRMADLGLYQQVSFHSQTSQYGTLSRSATVLPELEARMQKALDGIKDGSFAREWELERAAGYPVFSKLKAAALAHPVNDAERKLRELLGM